MFRLIFVLLLTSAAGTNVSAAEESPNRPNLVVLEIAGLADVGAPAWGLENVLPDPEIRARVTPNATKLAEMGARFANVFITGRNEFAELDVAALRLHQRAGYRFTRDPNPSKELAPHRVDSQEWSLEGEQATAKRWKKLIPTTGGEDDLSIEAWERLVELQPMQRAATWTATQIAESPQASSPQLLVTRLDCAYEPWNAAGVFFDRFPLDQISLPDDEQGLQSLAARMGIRGVDPERLAADPETSLAWRRAIQAWLATASATDYAVGKIIDAVEAANGDDDPDNDWVILFVATPPETNDADQAIQELAARADVLIVASEVTEGGQQVPTPVGLDDVLPTLLALANAEPVPAMSGQSLLPLLKHPCYETVALTTVGDAIGIRSSQFRLARLKDGTQQFYDLARDPAGQIDLLNETNEVERERSGLSPTQIESITKWLKEAVLAAPPTDYAKCLPGDFNRDKVVNAADKTVWRDNLGDEVASPGAGADANHNARVDEEDGEIWRANYGRRVE